MRMSNTGTQENAVAAGAQMTPDSLMDLPQGDPQLLQTALAQELLTATLLARLAYNASDGTPRLVPTWFTWTGEEVVMFTYVAGQALGIRHPARRVAALRARPDVAITIDRDGPNTAALLIRGRATVTEINGLFPEHIEACRRYVGQEAADEMARATASDGVRSAMIAVLPRWVGLIDFRTRMPSPRGGPQGG